MVANIPFASVERHLVQMLQGGGRNIRSL